MLAWLLVNAVLSALALVFITLNGGAPHRVRFFAGFAALVAWLVPWPLLPDLLPANLFSFELWRIERAVASTGTRLTGVIPVVVTTSAGEAVPRFIVLTVLELGFIALTAIGCALFAWKVAAHLMLLRQLERSGADGNWLWARAGLAPVCPVNVQRAIAGAFSSGLLKPRIWVHGDLVQSPQLRTLLQHEVTHLRQHDNWYLLAITFVERVIWWNPLTWYLGRRTRELQELSCDEACQRSNSDYPIHLAQLMIDAARGGSQPRMLALGANIFDKPNPNVKRIQLLQRSYTMTKKHVLGAALTAASAFLAVGFVTAQPETQAVPGQRMQLFTLEGETKAAEDILFVSDEAGTQQRVRMTRGVATSGGPAGDQFVKIDSVNGEAAISLTFTNAPLPMVLMPLVGLINHDLPPPGVAIPTPVWEDLQVIHGLSSEELVEKFNERDAHFVGHPSNDKLVLEYADAANKLVSVSADNLPLDEAIAAIAEASGCNIFQDGDTLVVDYCD